MSHHTLRGTGSSWLVPLADLSLILFIITAASLATRPDPAQPRTAQPQAVGSFAQGVPASVFIDLPGGPALGEWLADYHPASGEQLTIEGHFIPADRSVITARAEHLAQQALAAGFQPRLILQPAAGSQVQALFAADAAAQVAQTLRGTPEQ
jgi:hypothetical protein